MVVNLKNFKTKMTRTYICKTQTTYPEQQLQLAVIKGIKYQSVKLQRHTTYQRKLFTNVHNKVPSHGRGTATVISTAFEFVLVLLLTSLADWGFARMFADVITVVNVKIYKYICFNQTVYQDENGIKVSRNDGVID